METYEVNKDTVALIPKGDNETIVYELDDSFIVKETPLKKRGNSQNIFEGRITGATKLVGFTHKVPIIVEESRNMIFFPTLSPKNSECSWVAYKHINKPEKFKDKTILEVNNGKKIIINVSDNIIDNQLYRCSRLKKTLDLRKKDH